MTIYVANVVTDSGDHYTWLFKNEPTREDVIKRLWELECAADLDWYEETTSVRITAEEVIE